MWNELGGLDGVMINIKTHLKRPTEVVCEYVRA